MQLFKLYSQYVCLYVCGLEQYFVLGTKHASDLSPMRPAIIQTAVVKVTTQPLFGVGLCSCFVRFYERTFAWIVELIWI